MDFCLLTVEIHEGHTALLEKCKHLELDTINTSNAEATFVQST